MADRTHPHDTSKPAMSDETVPSEEFVSVPREPTHEMKEAGARENQGMYPIAIYRAMIAAAPAPNPSPAAKGGDAVRERFDCERDEDAYTVTWPEGRWLVVSEDGTLTHGKSPRSKDFAAVRTSLAALSTLTEGPAFQAEGMGGDAVREAFRAGWKVNAVGTDVHPQEYDVHPQEYLDDCEEVDWGDYAARAALTPPATAEAVPPLYLIRKGGAFYRPNSQGYTRSIAEAGRYSLAEAEAITHPNGPNGPRDGMDYIPAPALASDPAPATDDRERLVKTLPKLDDGLIRAALEAHYGKKAVRELGIMGVDLTVGDVNWPFRDGFRRMWAGIRKELKRRAALATEARR